MLLNSNIAWNIFFHLISFRYTINFDVIIKNWDCHESCENISHGRWNVKKNVSVDVVVLKMINCFTSKTARFRKKCEGERKTTQRIFVYLPCGILTFDARLIRVILWLRVENFSCFFISKRIESKLIIQLISREIFCIFSNTWSRIHFKISLRENSHHFMESELTNDIYNMR